MREQSAAETIAALQEEVDTLRQRLAELESRFRNQAYLWHVVESNADAMVVLCNGIVQFVNPAAERLFARSKEALLGHELGMPVIVTDKADMDIPHRDGTRQVAEMRVVEIDWDGRPAQLLSFRDVTARKQLEERQAALIRECTSSRDMAIAKLSDELVQRQEIEQALRESEERFRTIADFTYDWEYWLDPSGVCVYVSPSCERITGYSKEAFLRDPALLIDIVHPDDRVRIEHHIQDEHISPHASDIEFRILTRDGQERWLSHVCQPVYGHDGRWLGRRASNRDITERVVVQEALRESERKFRSIVEQSPDGINLADEHGVVIEWNHGAECITGFRRGDVIGNYYWDVLFWMIPPERKTATTYTTIRESIQNFLKSGTAPWVNTFMEQAFCRRDGTIRYAQELCFSIRTQRGYMACAVFRDITERKDMEIALREAHNDLERRVRQRTAELLETNAALQQEIEERRRIEDSLRKSEEQFRAFFEQAPIGIGVSRDGIAISVNPAFHRMFGYPLDVDLAGTPILQFNHPSEHAAILERLHRHRQGQPFEARFPLLCQKRDGTPLPTICNVTEVDLIDGKPATVGFFVDMTEHHRAEEQIQRRNQQLAALNSVIAAVNRSLELSEVLTTLRTLLTDDLDIVAGAIFLYHHDEELLTLETAWGMPAPLMQHLHRIPLGEAHNRRVVYETTPLVIHHLCPEFLVFQYVISSIPTEWCSYLGVPLTAQGQVQGVIDLFSSASATFSPDKIDFFVALGQQVGIALQKARLFEQVSSARERLQALSRRLVEIQEEERHRIARELHDEVGQILTGLNLNLEMMIRLPKDQITHHLTQAQLLINDLTQRVREMSLELRPPMLDDLGLLPSLLWHFERYTAQTGIAVIFRHEHIDRRFPPAIETAVYRMIQESLTNVARHAHVSEVIVRLWADSEILGVHVEDHGVGFDAETVMRNHASSGLTGMHERVRLLGGKLVIDSVPGGGSCLAVELPLPS